MVTVLVRPFFVYGPGLLHLDKLVPSMIRSVLKGEPAHLKSPHREMDWVYIDDVVEGFVRATALDSAVGREVDLGSGELVSILGVWSVLRDLRPHLPEPVFEHDASRRDEVSPIADTESCVLALGWKPSTSLNVGLARTLEWYSLVDRST